MAEVGMIEGLLREVAMRDRIEPQRFSRRDLIVAAAAGGAVGLAAGAAPAATAFAATPTQPIAPDEALKRLMDGNARYVAGKLTADSENLSILHAKTAERQRPFAAVLSCADSRVPAEIVFDQTIGHIFVCRVAGNIATPAIIGSLEFGAAVLGTSVLMVLGHASCGAVSATMQNQAVPGQISGLYPYIRPAVDQAGSDLDAAIRANARYQASLLQHASPVFAGLIKDGKLKIVAAHYYLETGKVAIL
ncbi:MAG TPA: carbonic anhydrase [bacterium]|nr:carbonic anhydrase [bacterium]